MKKTILTTATLSLLATNLLAQTEITPASWNHILTHSRTVDAVISDINQDSNKKVSLFIKTNIMQADKGEKEQPWSVNVDGADAGIKGIRNGFLAIGNPNLYFIQNSITTEGTGTIGNGLEFSESSIVGTYPLVDDFSMTAVLTTKSKNKVEDNSFLSEKERETGGLLMGNFIGQKILFKGGIFKSAAGSMPVIFNKYQHNENYALETNFKHLTDAKFTTTELTNTFLYTTSGRELAVSLKGLKTDNKELNDGLVTKTIKYTMWGSNVSYFQIAASESSEFSKDKIGGARAKVKIDFFEMSISKNFSEDLEKLPVTGATMWNIGLNLKF